MTNQEREILYSLWDKEERLRNASMLQARKMKEFYAPKTTVVQADPAVAGLVKKLTETRGTGVMIRLTTEESAILPEVMRVINA